LKLEPLGPDFEKPPGLGLERLAAPGLNGLLLGRAPPALGLPLLVVKGRPRPPSARGGREGPALVRPGAPELERSKRGFSKAGFSKRGLSKPGFAKRGFGGPDLSNLDFSKRGFGGPDLSKPGFSKRGLAGLDFSNLGLSKLGLPKLGLPVRGRSNGGRPVLERAGLLLRVSGR
jgi:hypothetical protein